MDICQVYFRSKFSWAWFFPRFLNPSPQLTAGRSPWMLWWNSCYRPCGMLKSWKNRCDVTCGTRSPLWNPKEHTGFKWMDCFEWFPIISQIKTYRIIQFFWFQSFFHVLHRLFGEMNQIFRKKILNWWSQHVVVWLCFFKPRIRCLKHRDLYTFC